MISRRRRKELLLEILSETEKIGKTIYLPNTDYRKDRIITNLNDDFVFQDKFCLVLEAENILIEPGRIKGFRIENVNGHNLIKVKTFLHISDWIRDFEKIEIIKVYFFDAMNQTIKSSFDYDVAFKAFYLDCDYSFRDYLTPVYEYEIFECPYKK